MKNMSRMKRFAVVIAAAASVFAVSCQKESESPSTLSLAVNDIVINLDAAKGSEHVLVYARGQWNAALKESSDWLTVENGSGYGNGEFVISFTENTGLQRRAEIELSASGVEKVICLTVNQKSAVGSPTIEFAESRLQYIAWETTEEASFTTNVEESALKVESTETWIKDLSAKDGKVTFTLEENTSGAERSAKISLTYTDVEEKVYRAVLTVIQTAEPGSLVIGESEMTVDAFEARKSVAWDCHLGTFFSRLDVSVEYEGDQKDWISDVKPTVEGLNFTVAANTVRAERKAVIKAGIADKGISVALTVTQVAPTTQYSFEKLRDLLSSAGEHSFDGDWFEGVIVADAGQKNMETNPMTSDAVFSSDESQMTNYIQSADGKYGLRLKFTAAETSLRKGDKVKVSLAGTTLVREDSPVRYTLKGLTANSVAVEESGSLPAKEKTIASLSDDDIYTWTTLKNVEIAFSYGSYNNAGTSVKDASNWIKNKKQNMDYRILSDASCSTIKMLVNSDVEWLRTQNGVPQGSGDISGVVVNTVNGYFHDAELLGKYQIRPMELSDIALNETGFSEKVVEWYWPSGKGSKPDLHYDGLTWIPSYGSGSFTGIGKLNQTSGFMETGSTQDPKAMRWDSVLWNVADGKAGEGFTISFSTENVAANKLVLVFSAAGGSQKEDASGQTPVNWNISYSIGDAASVQLRKIFIRPLPASASTGMKLPLTPDEFFVELPSELLGKAKVTLRLQAADDTAIDFSSGEYTAKVTTDAAQTFRFGAVVVKSIK